MDINFLENLYEQHGSHIITIDLNINRSKNVNQLEVINTFICIKCKNFPLDPLRHNGDYYCLDCINALEIKTSVELSKFEKNALKSTSFYCKFTINGCNEAFDFEYLKQKLAIHELHCKFQVFKEKIFEEFNLDIFFNSLDQFFNRTYTINFYQNNTSKHYSKITSNCREELSFGLTKEFINICLFKYVCKPNNLFHNSHRHRFLLSLKDYNFKDMINKIKRCLELFFSLSLNKPKNDADDNAIKGRISCDFPEFILDDSKCSWVRYHYVKLKESISFECNLNSGNGYCMNRFSFCGGNYLIYDNKFYSNNDCYE